MAWNEQHTLGVAEMDATHHEFIELLHALLKAGDDEFPACFEKLHEHTKQHFEHEGKLMKACRFPAIGEHHSEHLRVLGELAHFARAVKAGRLGNARAYIRAMPEWFSHHIATMDAALAGSLKKA